jgi:hypothetical protein
MYYKKSSIISSFRKFLPPLNLDLLSSSFLLKYVNIKIHRTKSLSAATYGCQTWCFTFNGVIKVQFV